MNKKIGLFLLSLCILILPSKAIANESIKPSNHVEFIYLHGSNCNTQKDFDAFKKQIGNLHKYVIKNFNKNDVVKENLLENGHLFIDESPEVFIWGDRSKFEIDMLSDLLDFSRLFSPKMAQLARSIFAHCLHDAIWVQNYYNMMPILEDLHKEVLKQQNEGDKVVLLGYSAGTFITLRYILGYSPVIEPSIFFKTHGVNLTENDKQKIDKIKTNKTCLSAIMNMKSVYLKETSKDVRVGLDKNKFFDEYSKLNETTKLACYDDKAFKGIINFGSPLFLFDSSLTNPQTELGQYSTLVLANYVSKGHFWLSLNFREDPLGFSDDHKYHAEVVEDYLKQKLEEDDGFLYDNSTMRANRPFITAHYAYLTRYKLFAKNMAKSFSDAYKAFYGAESKEK